MGAIADTAAGVVAWGGTENRTGKVRCIDGLLVYTNLQWQPAVFTYGTSGHSKNTH